MLRKFICHGEFTIRICFHERIASLQPISILKIKIDAGSKEKLLLSGNKIMSPELRFEMQTNSLRKFMIPKIHKPGVVVVGLCSG